MRISAGDLRSRSSSRPRRSTLRTNDADHWLLYRLKRMSSGSRHFLAVQKSAKPRVAFDDRIEDREALCCQRRVNHFRPFLRRAQSWVTPRNVVCIDDTEPRSFVAYLARECEGPAFGLVASSPSSKA